MQIYRSSVLTAFQEVEDTLIAVKVAQARETIFQMAKKQAHRAYQLSKNRYDAGAIDFQTLLDMQDVQLSVEDNYTKARLARLTAAVNLYHILGGGWKS